MRIARFRRHWTNAFGAIIPFVIPSEARNLSYVQTQEKRDSSARSAPRNDKNLSFSASCSACLLLNFVSSTRKSDRLEACPTCRRLHSFVVRAAASLRRDPGDDFVGVGDVAGLAMHAVRRVDLQPRLAFFLHHFID